MMIGTKFYSYLLLGVLAIYSDIPTSESARDGCSANPCGNGAQCRVMDNFAIVCECPESTVGDPFVACRPSPMTASTTTSSSSVTERMTFHHQPIPTSPQIVTASGVMVGTTPQTSSSYSSPTITTTSGSPVRIVDSSSSRRNDNDNSYNIMLNTNSHMSPSTNSRDAYVNRGSHNDMNRQHDATHSSSNPSSNFNNNYNDYRGGIQQDSNYGNTNTNFQNSQVSPHSTNRENNYIVKDPLGIYANCKSINNVIVCADESDADSQPNNKYDSSIRHSASTVGQNSFNHRSNQNYDNGPSSSGFTRQEFVVSSHDSNTKYSGSGQNNVPQPIPGDPETCKQYCGKNAMCRMLLGRPICGCPAGTTGDPAVNCVPAEDELKMNNRCQKHTDCSETMICSDDSQCVDPCIGNNSQRTIAMENRSSERDREVGHFDRTRGGRSSMMMTQSCGANAKCQVIRHTQLCGCLDGFTGNPYNGCVVANNN